MASTDELLETLTGLWLRPQSCKSNFAREQAVNIAAASSRGLITTDTPQGCGTMWRITSKGLRLIERKIPHAPC